MATFDYTSRDYFSIRQDLLKRSALTIPEWNSDDPSDFGNMIVDLWAYMGDVLHFYVDRAASETFLDTATQRDSVMAIANLLDYTPSSPRSARGTVNLKITSFPSSSSSTFTISSATVSGSAVTYTTATNHLMTVGQVVTVSGMTPTTFNISEVVISAVPTGTTFTIQTTGSAGSESFQGKNLVVPTGSSTAGGVLAYNQPYVLPQYAVLTGYDANSELLYFYLSSSETFTKVNQSTTVSLVQGSVVSNEALGIGSGRSNQFFSLVKKGVDFDSVSVQVYEGPVSGGEPTPVSYQKIENMSTADFNDKVFTVRMTSDGTTQVVFGNGFNGFIPTINARITASYRASSGSLGNVGVNKISFVTGEHSPYFFVESSSAFSGGSDSESIESIKVNVSKLLRTQDRAVSLQDYKDLTLQITGVSKATAVYSAPNLTIYPVPHLTVYPPEPITDGATTKVVIAIPQDMAQSIDNYFSTRSMLGVTAAVVNPTNHGTIDKYIECTPVYVGMQVYVKSNFVQSWVQRDVDSAIRELLSFSKVSFGQTLTVGEVYRAALNVNGVDYVTLTNLHTVFDTTPATVGTVNNVTADSAVKLMCFTDKMTSNSVPNATAVNLIMYGGITGSN
jgi:hypothetical protein